MKLYFVRHGESEANILRVVSNRGLVHGLTEKGRGQATALAEKLKQGSVARIFSSPLLRAIQTAEIVSVALGVPFQVTDALCEYDCGVLEGKSDEASWAEHRAVIEDWIYNKNWDRRSEGGESLNDIRARFVPFIEQLVCADRDTPGAFVLIGHGGVYRTMFPLVFANIDAQFTLDHSIANTGIIVGEPIDGKLLCRQWCDIGLGV